MSNFRSFVERTVHLQLQHLTDFRPLVPLFVAIIVFSSIPTVGRASLASIATLSSSLSKALTKSGTSDGVPLLNSLLHIFTRALNTASLRVRIHIHVPSQWRWMFHRDLPRPRSDDTYYPTSRAEAKHWRVAGRYRRRLYSGNGSTSAQPSKVRTAPREGTVVPLVTYYTPRLLPLYRDRGDGKASRDADAAREAWVSPKTFCKWHRMVFQDSCHHPTFAQATMQIKYYSNRDLREIQRIARLLSDEQVFGSTGKGARKAKKTTKYKEMWQRWLENKGTDLVIVFE